MEKLSGEHNLVLTLSLAGNDTANYLPSLKRSLGTLNEAVLLSRIARVWKENGGRPFFYFTKPSTNPSYRTGFSWYEVLGLEPKEVKEALSGIGTQLGKGKMLKADFLAEETPEMNESGALENKAFLVGWLKDEKGRIWYRLNEVLFDAYLEEISNQETIPGNNLAERASWKVEQLSYYQGSLQRELAWCQSELRVMVGSQRAGYVFFLSDGKGLFKFEAAKELNADTGGDAKIGVIRTDNIFRLQQCIHYTFRDLRHEGEWFEVDTADPRLVEWMSMENGEFFFGSEQHQELLERKVKILEEEIEIISRMLWKPESKGADTAPESGLKPLLPPKTHAEVLEMLEPSLKGLEPEVRKSISETAIANFDKLKVQSDSKRRSGDLTAIGSSVVGLLPERGK